jgi:hypothetical protein
MRIPADVAERVRADREAGMSFSQIGKRHGIAPMSAKRIVTGAWRPPSPVRVRCNCVPRRPVHADGHGEMCSVNEAQEEAA